MTAQADARHDVVGFGFGLLFIFVLPAVMVFKMLSDSIGRWKWRRDWERRHGMPWRESEAAKQEGAVRNT